MAITVKLLLLLYSYRDALLCKDQLLFGATFFAGAFLATAFLATAFFAGAFLAGAFFTAAFSFARRLSGFFFGP